MEVMTTRFHNLISDYNRWTPSLVNDVGTIGQSRFYSRPLQSKTVREIKARKEFIHVILVLQLNTFGLG